MERGRPLINPLIQKAINPFPSIRAITFDAGGTLIQPWPSVGHVYAAVAARHGLGNLSVEILNRQFATAWKNLNAFNYTRSEWCQLVNQSFAGLAQTPLSEIFFADLYSDFGRAEAWRIFDDVIPTLGALRSLGVKLGIISNWDERLRRLLRDLGLDQYFQMIAISCEIGACKPSPAIFKQAAQMLGVAPREILHVGDSQAMDVAGATGAGIHALLLSREPIAKPGQLGSLSELLTTNHGLATSSEHK